MSELIKMRLRDNHPDKQKFDKLVEYANSIGIQINFFGMRTMVLIDNNQYELEDCEASDDPNEPVSDFPPVMDYKLVYEKEASPLEYKALLKKRKAACNE